tara:strand:- start:723 stop:1325 length:603 start_codon:yes stop_codon:yes gene_type:complete
MKELKFIHITKCAGTSIETLGNENNILWGINHQEEYGFWHEPFNNKSIELKKKYDWFMVVRNPYTRILSEYYCEWGGIGKKRCIPDTKEKFNNLLISNIKDRHKPSLGFHYIEQSKYYTNDEDITINIIKFENLSSELDLLFKKYNLNIDINSLKTINTKKDKNKSLPFTINDFNNELINLINNVYSKDFELFNYKKISI